jgi:hypothetical protein
MARIIVVIGYSGTGAEVLRDTKGRFKKYEEHPNDK